MRNTHLPPQPQPCRPTIHDNLRHSLPPLFLCALRLFPLTPIIRPSLTAGRSSDGRRFSEVLAEGARSRWRVLEPPWIWSNLGKPLASRSGKLLRFHSAARAFPTIAMAISMSVANSGSFERESAILLSLPVFLQQRQRSICAATWARRQVHSRLPGTWPRIGLGLRLKQLRNVVDIDQHGSADLLRNAYASSLLPYCARGKRDAGRCLDMFRDLLGR
ncbi:Hypothetical protein NGAL_HAMBI1145_16150 [Neorhizobium galegae bv. officinalis]|uniref:Uncharacterized protein n=1 Tax=Neorhizobium galegae bv. officinalis TaxID=323656 RepID=A0A0T7FDM2_NEOGA|nr:Hypothetical protein NGAL_HAMBI1145_16150 [Neorhizobium galegae bv. officinalis]